MSDKTEGKQELDVKIGNVDYHIAEWTNTDGKGNLIPGDKMNLVFTFGTPYFTDNIKNMVENRQASASNGTDSSSNGITRFDDTGKMYLDRVLGKTIIISAHDIAKELSVQDRRKSQERKDKTRDDE